MHQVTRRNFVLTSAAAATAFAVARRSHAQVPQYGVAINLEHARKAIAAGQAEARKNNWPVAIAIVDNHGFLVAFEKMDNTQTASVQIAIDKASSAAMYRRPTKVFQDLVAGGGAGTRTSTCVGHPPWKVGCRSSSAAGSLAVSVFLGLLRIRMVSLRRRPPTRRQCKSSLLLNVALDHRTLTDHCSEQVGWRFDVFHLRSSTYSFGVVARRGG